MATLGDLVEDVLGLLHGHTGQDENVTYLTAAIDADDLTLTLGSAEGLRRGVVEIDDELLWVDSINTTSNTVTIAPFGRGYRGTTAASHVINSRVNVNPLLPRQRVKRAINDTIEAVGGELFAVENDSFEYDAGVIAYELPAADFPNLLDVISMSWYSDNTSEVWLPIRRWKFYDKADTTSFPSGKSVEIYEPVQNGTDVNVVFTRTPQPFADGAAESAVFTTTTLLPASCRDVITYGAASRLAWGIEGGRTNQTGVSAQALAEAQGWRGSSANLGKQLYAFHRQRVQEERDQLLRTTPPTVHYLR